MWQGEKRGRIGERKKRKAGENRRRQRRGQGWLL